jgi:hypothetical protein
MASLRSLAISILRLDGHDNIAVARRSPDLPVAGSWRLLTNQALPRVDAPAQSLE